MLFYLFQNDLKDINIYCSFNNIFNKQIFTLFLHVSTRASATAENETESA